MILKVKTLKKLLTLGALALMLFQAGCHTDFDGNTARMASTSESTHSALFNVHKRYISGSAVGSEYRYLLEVTALEDVGNVLIEERLPKDIRFIDSSPAAKVDGDTVFWAFSGMNRGETKTIEISYSPEKGGAFKLCTVVSADPRVCVALVAGMPNLKVEKNGPAFLNLGEEAVWIISATNTGTAVAQDVRITDTLPEGLEAISSTDQFVGDIAPGQTKQMKVLAKAARPGKFNNVAGAFFKEGKTEVQTTAPLEIVEHKISVTKEGPETAYVLSPATYTIVVRNTGAYAVEDLRVVDFLPEFVNVVESGGGTLSGTEISWKIDRLEPFQSKTYNVRFAANNPGQTLSKVQVWNNRGVKESAELITKWQSAPGVHMSIIDQKDPIRVGQDAVYQIRVLNQGAFEPVGTSIRVTLSEELKPTNVRSNFTSTINGQDVLFNEVQIEPGKEINAQITAQAVKVGNGKAIMQLKADFLPRVLVSEESTTIY